MSQRMPSIELIHEMYERERDRDAGHFESIDTKSGLVMGFAGIVVTLNRDGVTALGSLGLVAATVAAGLALGAFWPRELPVLEPAGLRQYVLAEEQFTRLTVVDTYLDHFAQSRSLLSRKARKLKLSMLALAMAVVGVALDRIGEWPW